jgi:succinyl-diaminopimelate desuccinylase
MAEVGPADAPTLVLHGHIDVVPGEAEMFRSRMDGDRLYGRGTYDMKGALAVMLLVLHDLREQDQVRVRLGIVSDEESEEEENRGSDALVGHGFIGDFAITGEPTNLQVGVQAKGVLALRLEVRGRSAHGATPWLGDNAVVKAVEVFRGIESLPFARQSSALFDRPSINLGRIWGGDALNKVPDICVMDVDIRFLPEQDPEEIRAQVEGMPDTRVLNTFRRPPAVVEAEDPFVLGLCEATSPHHPERVMSVGRDGASDAVSFRAVGRGDHRLGRQRRDLGRRQPGEVRLVEQEAGHPIGQLVEGERLERLDRRHEDDGQQCRAQDEARAVADDRRAVE